MQGHEPVVILAQPRPLAVVFVAVALLAALLAASPYARVPTHGTEVFVAAYGAASFVLEIITAVLLFALFYVQGGAALGMLASGYLFSALTLPAWVMSFPGVFEGLGVEPGLQTTATIAALRRLAFAVCLLAYALAPTRMAAEPPAFRTILLTVAGVCGAAVLALGVIDSGAAVLPPFMRDRRDVNALWLHVAGTVMAVYLASLGLLLRRRKGLDLWICLVIFSLVIELLLLSFLGGGTRLSLGWWAGRLYGLTAAGIVLLALLADTATIHARLLQSSAAERRARQNRLTAMEALSASIAHEINQPLASMITNADAGLRWLARSKPESARVEEALRRIVADGHRANKVVSGIRTMFMKGAQERAPLDLNAVITEVLLAASPEARIAGIPIEVALDPRPAIVIGNALQLSQVVSNLVENAIDAMRSVPVRHRTLILRTRRLASGEVEVAVEDSGAGVPAGMEQRIFEPFVSTKAGGMGMGLMFCRAVVEAHGGMLRVSPNRPRGAIFRFALPAAEGSGRDAGTGA